MRRLVWVSLVALLAASLLACTRASATEQATITLNPGTTFQTIVGWEATAQAGQIDSPAFPNYQATLFDQAVNDLGLNRLRVEVTTSGSGFNLARLDNTITTVVLPMRSRLQARGENLFINVCVADNKLSNDPNGYAQAVLAVYQHMQQTYGFVPDSWEIALEPDVFQWPGATAVANAMVATGNLLAANGFSPVFVAPSNSSVDGALNYFDDIAQVPGALQYLRELSYHRYSGASDANVRAIAQRAAEHGLQTAMLEHIGADYNQLHTDLTIGMNSAWQQFTLAYPMRPGVEQGAQYYEIDDSNPSSPIVRMGTRTKFLRQYFKYIRAGAVRIEAGTSNGALDPVAFINTDGKYVVVVKADSGGSFSVDGLPAGTYGVKYTTADEYDVDLPDISVGAGQPANAAIPAPGVITVYARSGAPPEPTETKAPTSTATTRPSPTGTGTPTESPPATETATTVPTLDATATSTLLPSLTPTPTNIPSNKLYLPLLLSQARGPAGVAATVAALVGVGLIVTRVRHR